MKQSWIYILLVTLAMGPAACKLSEQETISPQQDEAEFKNWKPPFPSEPSNTQGISVSALERPAVPVTKLAEVPTGKKANSDIPEGRMIVDRLCVLQRDEGTGWYYVQCAPQDGKPVLDLWVQPTQLLERMEQIHHDAKARGQSPEFRVSGEATVYRNLGYLVLTKVILQESRTAIVASSPGEKPDLFPSPTALSTRPAVTASADEVMKLLKMQKPGRPVVAPSRVDPATMKPSTSVAPVENVQEIDPSVEGIIADRVVYIVPEEGTRWYLVRFSADNTLREPPLRILPSLNLEKAQRLVAIKKFTVSGDVHIYKGRRYLLVRKLLREEDLGQF